MTTLYEENVIFRCSKEFKELLNKLGDEETRTRSNFIVNALLHYMKEVHDVDGKPALRGVKAKIKKK